MMGDVGARFGELDRTGSQEISASSNPEMLLLSTSWNNRSSSKSFGCLQQIKKIFVSCM